MLMPSNDSMAGTNVPLTKTRGGFRYQTTTSKDGNNNPASAEQDEEERLLANIEEIIDIPAEAFEGLIDRSKYTEVVPVRMPDLGTSQDNAPDRLSQVQEWFFQPGTIVQRGNVLCDIATPDFTFGMETDDEELGIMGEIPFVPCRQTGECAARRRDAARSRARR
jgi:hypothetical protein